MKVLVTSTSFQDTPGKHQQLLKEQDFNIEYLRGPLTEEELLPIIDQYDAIICGDDEYTEKVLKKGARGKLKHISKYGVGLDKIDLNAAKKLKITVTNCPGVNQVSVAEHVLALLLTFEKNVHLQYQTTKEGSWERMIGREINKKTIGIIGLGAIGKELAKRCLALGMNVIAFDIREDKDFLNKHTEIKFFKEISPLYYESDYISLHLPLSSETKDLINKDVISNKLRKKPVIINSARGGLVDTEAIIFGLRNDKIRGYLTDVLLKEPMEKGEKLRGLKNVIITPHIGSRTFESVERQGLMAVKNLLNSYGKSC